MSIDAISWALSVDLPNAGQKLTLIAICNFANESDEAWPSQERLARDTSQSPRSVRNHLAALEKAGFIKRRKRKKQDGSFNSDMISIQRQNLPAANPANGKKAPSPAAKSAAKPSIDTPNGVSEPSDQFEAFWSEYPRKVAKGAARKAFKSAIKKTTIEEILCGVRGYVAHKPDYADYAHPATWLNGERWNDEYPTNTQQSKQSGNRSGGSILDAAARFQARRKGVG